MPFLRTNTPAAVSASPSPKISKPVSAPPAPAVLSGIGGGMDLRNWQAEATSGLRILGFYILLAFVFLRFSFLHELLSFGLHINLYLVVVFGSLTGLTLILSGGLRRALDHRISKLWVAFAAVMCAATIFSHYITGSLEVLKTWLKSELIMYFMIAGLVMSVREVIMLMKTVAAGVFITVLMAAYFGTTIKGNRFALEFGSIGNPNDFATHLLLLLPFVFLAAQTARSMVIIKRVVWFAFSAGALYYSLSTASRAAVMTIAVALVFILFRMRGLQRFIIALLVIVTFIGASLTLPDRVVRRYTTFFDWDSAGEELSEAVGSAEARTELARKALIITIRNPIFGVGPGEFSDVNGEMRSREGLTGQWQVTHNSYLQVSSENGIPALLLYISAIGSGFLIASTAYRAARSDPAHRELATAAFYLTLAFVICGTSLFFCSLGYRYYFPVLTGLSVALWAAIRHDPRYSHIAVASESSTLGPRPWTAAARRKS